MSRPRRIPQKKIPEQTLALGILLEDVRRNISDSFELDKGINVEIARIVRTPVGLFFRIKNTTRWLGEAQIKCEFDQRDVADYQIIGHPEKTNLVSRTRDRQIPNGLNQKGVCGKPVHVSSKNHNGSGVGPHKRLGFQGRIKTVDKKDLKTAILSLNAGDQVSVTFLSSMPSSAQDTRYDGIREFAGQTVEFTFVETKKGRGKGGSQLMVLKAGDDKKVITGTPHSEALLNVSTPAGRFGLDSESEVPRSFETNAGQASELKDSFKELVGTVGAKVCMESPEAEYTGTFTVTDVKKLRGRHGQICLSLTADDGRTTEVWSYRHSGVISKFEVLSKGEMAVTEKALEVADEADADSTERI